MLKHFNIFKKPSHLQVVAEQLDNTKHSLLEAQANKEYFEGMCDVLQKRIVRLSDIYTNEASIINDNQKTFKIPPHPTGQIIKTEPEKSFDVSKK